MEHMPQYNLSHIGEVFRTKDMHLIIPKAKRFLKTMEFDAIAFRGMSGCLFAAVLAYELRKPMIMVRKRVKRGDGGYTTDSHSSMFVEGDQSARTYIIVDDFIASGATVREIHKEIKEVMPEARCIGIMTAGGLMSTIRKGYTPNGQKLHGRSCLSNDCKRSKKYALLPINMFVQGLVLKSRAIVNGKIVVI